MYVNTDTAPGFDEGMTIRNHIAYSYTTDNEKTKSSPPITIVPLTNDDPTDSNTRKTITARNKAVVISHDYCDVDEPDDLEAGTEDYEDPVPSSHVNKPTILTESGARSKDYEDPVPSVHINKHAVTELAMSKDYEEPIPSTHIPYRQTFV